MGFPGAILLPLSEPVGVVATRGRAATWELGLVRVADGSRGATRVEIEISQTDGRGEWRPGLWWDDEAEPRWADEPRRLAPGAVAIPLRADDDGAHLVRVLVEVQPLRPSTRASAVFASWFVA